MKHLLVVELPQAAGDKPQSLPQLGAHRWLLPLPQPGPTRPLCQDFLQRAEAWGSQRHDQMVQLVVDAGVMKNDQVSLCAGRASDPEEVAQFQIPQGSLGPRQAGRPGKALMRNGRSSVSRAVHSACSAEPPTGRSNT